MFGFKNKIVIETMEINKGYQQFVQSQDIILICSDEQIDYDNRHIMGAECFPLRIMDQFKEFYPRTDCTYYFYAINHAISERACKKAIKMGYKAVNLGSLVEFKGKEEGLQVSKKHRRRR